MCLTVSDLYCMHCKGVWSARADTHPYVIGLLSTQALLRLQLLLACNVCQLAREPTQEACLLPC